MSATALATSSKSTFDEIWGDEGNSSVRQDTIQPPSLDEDGFAESTPKRTTKTRRLFHSDEESDNEPNVVGSRKVFPPPLDPELEAMFPSDDHVDDEAWKTNKLTNDLDFDMGTRKSSSKTLEQMTREAAERHAKALVTESAQRKQGRAQASTSATGSSSTFTKTASAAPKAKDNDVLALPDDDGPKDSTKNERKRKKTLPKLDETRLLGPDGFTALIGASKRFKSKGKGHETNDLARALEMYQLWTHRLYPKTQFRDTAERVERLCRSRRMMMSLSVWRDEDKNGPRKPKDTAFSEEPIDLSPDEDGPDSGAEDSTSRKVTNKSKEAGPASKPSASSHNPGSQSKRAAVSNMGEDDYDIMMAEEFEAQQQMQKTHTNNVDDFWGDIDEVMRASSSTKPPQPPPTSSNSKTAAVDDDEALWRDMAGDEDALAAFMESEDILESAPKPSTHNTLPDDVEMDESSNALPTRSQPSAATSPTVHTSTIEDEEALHAMDDVTEEDLMKREATRKEFEEGWDDMYV